MEQQLVDSLSNLASQPGVVGILAADANGLCLSAQGNGSSSAAGFVKAITTRAQALSSNNEVPVVTIETESMNILIREQDNVAVAVYKLP